MKEMEPTPQGAESNQESLFMDHPVKGRVTTAEFQEFRDIIAAKLEAQGIDPAIAQGDAATAAYTYFTGNDPEQFRWGGILNDYLPGPGQQ